MPADSDPSDAHRSAGTSPAHDAAARARGSTGCGRAARDFLGCRLAIMGGAMSWVRERHLVAAISNAGGFGVIACGSMSADAAGRRDRRHAGADRPAVRRQPDHHASRSSIELIDVCLARKVGHVVLAGGTAAGGRGARGEGRRRQADLLHPGAGAGQAAGPHGRRRAGDRGHGGRRPYRPGRRPACWRRRSCRTSARCRSSSPAASAAARRSSPIWRWAPRARSSARASSARHELIAHPNFKQAFIRAARARRRALGAARSRASR